MDRESTSRNATEEPYSAPGPGRRPWTRPRLEVLGDLRALTLGGSPGIGDSGAINEDPFVP